MAHMHVTGVESEPPRPPMEDSPEPIAEISATLLRAQAFLSGCGIALMVREGDWLVCRASSGAASPEIGARMAVEHTFLGLCVTLKKPQSCEDADTDLRVENATSSRLRPKSILAVPVRAGQEVIGVLAGFSAAPNAFSHTQVAILRTVGDSLSRPVQQLPAAPPPPEPPAPRLDPGPLPAATASQKMPETIKSDPQPPTPAPPPMTAPAVREVVLTLADDVAPAPRLVEPRPAQPRVSAPTVRSITIPGTLHLSRPRPRRRGPSLLRIAAVTVVCLLGALATAGWYSTRMAGAPHALASPAAPVISQPAPRIETPAAPLTESHPAPATPATAIKMNTEVAPRAEEMPVKEPVAEAPAAEIRKPKLPQAPAAAVEAPALALNAPSGLPVLVAPHAAAPKIHHSEATPARLERRVAPDYPMVALKRHIAGEVVLSLRVRKDGSVSEVKMLSGNPLFRESAVDAVRKWRYTPATLDGQAVEATAQVELKFEAPAGAR